MLKLDRALQKSLEFADIFRADGNRPNDTLRRKCSMVSLTKFLHYRNLFRFDLAASNSPRLLLEQLSRLHGSPGEAQWVIRRPGANVAKADKEGRVPDRPKGVRLHNELPLR